MRLAAERPRKISTIIRRLLRGNEDDEDNREWFEDLLERTMPEHAWDILELDEEWEQVLAFADRFTGRYFPLHESYLEGNSEWNKEDGYYTKNAYEFLRDGIPFQHSLEELHDMWPHVRPGIAAMALPAEVPKDYQQGYGYGEFQGMREAWLEAAADEMPVETLQRIPEGGISLEKLEASAAGTPVAAVHLAVKWIWARTGNIFTDECFPDDFSYEFSDSWEDETIEYAAGEWKKADAMIAPVTELADWLEEDLPERFGQMLDLILPGLEAGPENPLNNPPENPINQSREEK